MGSGKSELYIFVCVSTFIQQHRKINKRKKIFPYVSLVGVYLNTNAFLCLLPQPFNDSYCHVISAKLAFKWRRRKFQMSFFKKNSVCMYTLVYSSTCDLLSNVLLLMHIHLRHAIKRKKISQKFLPDCRPCHKKTYNERAS